MDGRLSPALAWLQRERLRGTLFHRPNVGAMEPVHFEAAGGSAAGEGASVVLRGQHFVSILVDQGPTLAFQMESVSTHELCPRAIYALFGPQGETVTAGQVEPGRPSTVEVPVSAPGRYLLLVNPGTASRNVARLSVRKRAWGIEATTKRAYLDTPLAYHFLRELKLAGLNLAMLDFESLAQEFVSEAGLKKWTEKVEAWADHARRYQIRLMPAINIGGSSYEVEAWGDAPKGLYIEHLKNAPLAPCPLSEVYWQRLLLRRGREVARLSTRNPYVVGIGIDPEMYQCWKYGHYMLSGTCFCDRCFGGFLRRQGLGLQVAGQLADGKARHEWLTRQERMDQYDRYLEDQMARLASRLREELHKINPDFLLCVFVLDLGNWFCRGLSRGFGTDRVPAVNFSETTYYGVGYDPKYIEHANRAFVDWGAHVVPGYAVWDIYFPPTRRTYLAAHCYHLALRGGGYWLWPGCDLLAGDVGGRVWTYQGRPAWQPDYWLALRDANTELDRRMAGGVKYSSPLDRCEPVPWRGAYLESEGKWKAASGVEPSTQPVYPIHLAQSSVLRFLVPERVRSFTVLARPEGAGVTLKVLSPAQKPIKDASCRAGQDAKLEIPVAADDNAGLWTLQLALPAGAGNEVGLDLSGIPAYLSPPGALALVPQFKRGDLLGRWPFDAGQGTVAADASGPPPHDGIIRDAEWTKGKYGSALSFNGQNSHVRIPHSWSMDRLDQFTLAAWVNLRSLPSEGHGLTIVGKGPEAPVEHVWWWIGYDHSLVLEVGNAKHRWGTSFSTRRLPWELNRWYHVAVVFQSDGRSSTATFYRDGKALGTSTKQEAFDSGTYDLFLGAYDGGSAHVFDGRIDEVAFYNRALSPEEIAKLQLR